LAAHRRHTGEADRCARAVTGRRRDRVDRRSGISLPSRDGPRVSDAPVLAANSLTIRIGNRLICSDLHCSVYAGQCWAVLGRNGAGKTTLLHTLAGLRASETGKVEYFGRSVTSTPRRELARIRGLLPQDDHDPFSATVLETVLIGRHPHLGR